MGRKTHKRLTTEARPKFLTFYDDRNAPWINRLCEEDEELAAFYRPRNEWRRPKRAFLEFSTKDESKERQRHEAIQRKARRGNPRRQYA